MDSLPLSPRVSKFGCGIYEAGDTEKCYVKLFVTDGGFVLPVNHRSISEEDLLEVYTQGRLDERALVAAQKQEFGSKCSC